MADVQQTDQAAPQGEPTPPKAAFLQPFLVLTAMGLLGVASLVPIVREQLETVPLEDLPVPVDALAAVALFQSAVLVAIAVAVGLATAPKAGLTSLVVDRLRGGERAWPRLVPQLPLAVGLGLVVGAAILALDAVLLPLSGLADELAEAAMDPVTRLVMGLLYGGITEELLMRWALVGLLVWLPWRFAGSRGRDGGATPGVVWVAILVVAVIFGIGHLPALSNMVELNAALIARTVLLNAIGGVVYGWLFWRRSLEAAMVAHGSTHLAFAVGALASALIG